MAQALRIDFVSDVACPWCVIGLRGLLQALNAIGEEAQAEIYLQPFELNPDMGPAGENAAEHIARKYRSTPEQSAAVRKLLEERGAAVNFAFNQTPQSRIWNTFDAHRLLHWAELEGKGIALKQALFRANFTHQKSTSDHAVLAAAAEEAGLDGARARAILSTGEFAAEVRAAEDQWRRAGVNAVPTVIVNQRWIIQGGQPPDAYEYALREILAGRAQGTRASG